MKAIKSGFSSIYKHRKKGLIGILIIAAGMFSYDMYQKSFQDAVKDTGHVVTASYGSTKGFIKDVIAAW
jgi:hypothetical protein